MKKRHFIRCMFAIYMVMVLTMLRTQAVAQVRDGGAQAMVFKVVVPCTGNASFCGPRILGIGEITPETPRRFDEFVAAARATEQLPPTLTISLHSPGGNLAAGVALGQAIRRNGFDTLMQPSYEMVPPGTLREETIVSSSICASACAFAFIGGVNRSVWKGSRLGVHQFSSSGASGGEATAQFLQVFLSEYVQSMGVDRKLVDVAALTASASIYWLSDVDLKDMRIVTDAPSKLPWTITATMSGVPVLQAEQSISGDRVLRVLFLKKGDSIAMWLSLRIERTKTSQVRLPFFTQHEGPKVTLDFGGGVIEAVPVGSWRRRDLTDAVFLERAYLLPVTAGAAIAQARIFMIADDLHPAYRDLSLSTELSISGLREGIALLLRTAAK